MSEHSESKKKKNQFSDRHTFFESALNQRYLTSVTVVSRVHYWIVPLTHQYSRTHHFIYSHRNKEQNGGFQGLNTGKIGRCWSKGTNIQP